MADDVVISGIGILSPIGCGEAAFWDALCHGRSGARPISALDTTDLPRNIACEVRDSVDVGRPMGRASALAVSAARDAVTSAGLDPTGVDTGRMSIVIGTTMGETEFIEERLTSSDSEWLTAKHMRRIVSGRPGSIAGSVRDDLGVTCPAVDLYGACAAGNMAIASARRQLLSGGCDVALAGGADGFSRLAFLGFMRLRVMSTGICRPFDDARDGLLVGEGGAVFVLERESSVRARGARIRARVSGAGVTCESYHPTRPEPEGDGLSRATNDAIRDAGLVAGDIDYVCAHGTGTPQNDAIEMKVMERCFPRGVAFSSVKALTGHTMGAAAAVEAVCCVLSLEHQCLVPTWHLERVLQPCPLDPITGAIRQATLRHAANNSAGFGGYNSSLILSLA